MLCYLLYRFQPCGKNTKIDENVDIFSSFAFLADPDGALVWNFNNETAVYVDANCYIGPKCAFYKVDFRTNSSALTISRVNEETVGKYYCFYRQALVVHQVHMKGKITKSVAIKPYLYNYIIISIII